MTTGTRILSINECHGQGPVERERLEGQLGGAFLIISLNCCVRVLGLGFGANFKIRFLKRSWRCLRWEFGDSRIGEMGSTCCGGTSLPVNRWQVGGVIAPFLAHASHGSDACRLCLPPGRPVEEHGCSKGAVMFAGGYLGS